MSQMGSQVKLEFAVRDYDIVSENYAKAMIQTLMFLLQWGFENELHFNDIYLLFLKILSKIRLMFSIYIEKSLIPMHWMHSFDDKRINLIWNLDKIKIE